MAPRTLQQVVQSINEKHENVVYLAGRTHFFPSSQYFRLRTCQSPTAGPGISLSHNIIGTTSVADAVNGAEQLLGPESTFQFSSCLCDLYIPHRWYPNHEEDQNELELRLRNQCLRFRFYATSEKMSCSLGHLSLKLWTASFAATKSGSIWLFPHPSSRNGLQSTRITCLGGSLWFAAAKAGRAIHSRQLQAVEYGLNVTHLKVQGKLNEHTVRITIYSLEDVAWRFWKTLEGLHTISFLSTLDLLFPRTDWVENLTVFIGVFFVF